MDISQNINIPPLRQDLQIHPANQDFDGSPTWMIYDPISDNYFKIGWFEFECLQRFDRAKSSFELADLVNKETSLSIDNDDIIEFIGFLVNAGFLQANTAEIRKILEEGKSEKKKSLLHTLFLNYIFIRVPLFRPQNFLQNTFPYIKFMFTRSFLFCVLALLATGIFLTVQRWDDFLNTFTFFFSFENIILIMASTIVIKAVHEFGHAYMAHKHKVPVSTMGAILIVFYPIFYTETTNAWRIYDRKKRMQIAGAGLMAELSLASVALIVWHISSPGLVQNMSYFIGFISLFISIFINANPLMRFDGYYLLSDAIGIDNLQTRSFAFFKWKLRRVVCGLKEDIPETIPKKQAKFLTFFGAAQAIYMCFLYSGIAFAIYILIFKPLGFILAITLLAVFLGMPILREFMYWYQQREAIMQNNKPKIIFIILGFLLILSFLPLSRTITLPAVLHYQDYKSFHTQRPANINDIRVQNFQPVSQGEVLMVLSSETLEQEVKIARLKLERYQNLRKRQETSRELSQHSVELDQLIKEAKIELDGLLAESEEMTIRAPFNGVIRDISPEIHTGRSVNPNILLMRLINKEKMQVTGYVESEFIGRLENQADGHFRSDTNLFEKHDVKLIDISTTDTKSISYQELSSVYKGSIPADRVGEGNVQSKVPLYTLKFDITKTPENSDFTKQGTVKLKVKPTSFSVRILRKLTSLFLRETGI